MKTDSEIFTHGVRSYWRSEVLGVARPYCCDADRQWNKEIY